MFYEGSNLVVYQNSNSRPTQKFKFKALSDGSYHIVANTDDFEKVLNLNSSGTTNGTNVTIWGSGVDGNNYHWYLEPVNEEFSAKPEVGKTYVIRSLVNGKYAEIKNSVTDNTAEFIQGPYSANPNQMFTVVQGTKDSNTFMLSPGHAKDKVLSLTDHGISLEDPNDPTGQQLSFEKCPNGSYKVTLASIPELAWRIESFQIYEDGKEIIYFATRENTDVYYQWIFEEVSDTMLASAQYNDYSLISKLTNYQGNTVEYQYDPSTKQVTSLIEPNGRTTSYSYNSNTDQLLSMTTNSSNENSNTINYTYSYDDLTSVTSNGFSYNFVYDAFGNVQETKVGDQSLIYNIYLPNNMGLQSTTFGNGHVVNYHYDKYGREIQRDYNGTPVHKFKYNSYGYLVEHEDLNQNVTYRYQYDAIDRLVGMDTSHNQQFRVKYDDKNRIDYNISKIKDQTVKTSYVYGLAENSQHPSAIYGVNINDTPYVTYEYDNLARLSKRSLNTTTPFDVQYQYLSGDSIGTTTPIVSAITNGNSNISYTYDEMDNITSISENGELKVTYHYDSMEQLVREDNLYLNKTISYTYDHHGNILSVSEYPYTTGELGNPIATHTYTYDDANWKDKLTSYDGQTITYDQIGNPLQYRDNMVFTWENGRELANINHNISYQYNGDGIRIHKTVDGVDTDYYYNGDMLLTQISGDNRIDFYYDQVGGFLGFNYNGADYYYLFNAQSDVVGIVDSNGNIVVNYTYDSWGNPVSITGTLANTVGKLNPIRYRCYYYDNESGLYYLNNRYYDPITHRFLNVDNFLGIVDNTNAQNIFAYCKNNPVSNLDSEGNWTMSIGISGSAVLGGGLSESYQIVFDDNNNIGIQYSTSDCQGEEPYFGLFAIGFSGVIGATNADTIYDLEGYSEQVGGSIGDTISVGGDVIFFEDDTPNIPNGFQTAIGVGYGVDAHGYTSNTRTIWSGKNIVYRPQPKKPGLTDEQIAKIAADVARDLFGYGTDKPNKRQYPVCGVY